MPNIIRKGEREYYSFGSKEEFKEYFKSEILSAVVKKLKELDHKGLSTDDSAEKVFGTAIGCYERTLEDAVAELTKDNLFHKELCVATIRCGAFDMLSDYDRKVLTPRLEEVERLARAAKRKQSVPPLQQSNPKFSIAESTEGSKPLGIAGVVIGSVLAIHGTYVAAVSVREGRQRDDKHVDWGKVAFHIGEAALGATTTFVAATHLSSLGSHRI